jgi:hypothetical protein
MLTMIVVEEASLIVEEDCGSFIPFEREAEEVFRNSFAASMIDPARRPSRVCGSVASP